MRFIKHIDLENQHAFLSASKYHWINYSDDKIRTAYKKYLAVQKGTQLHNLAKELIEHRIPVKKTMKTFNMYVNDAIGYKMTPEQVLYFSENCFGTADAIKFDERKALLRIHDLKTGETRTSIHQLEVYNALFCLEYGVSPFDISSELRIYQNNEIQIHIPKPEAINYISEKIIRFDEILEELKNEE